MKDQREFLEWLVNEERKRIVPRPPAPPAERPTIHYTELGDLPAGSPCETEWNFYRKEVGRLLAEGHEGRWVLIVGEEIIGIWETREEALQVRNQRFLTQAVVVHQILEREPILRCGAYYRP